MSLVRLRLRIVQRARQKGQRPLSTLEVRHNGMKECVFPKLEQVIQIDRPRKRVIFLFQPSRNFVFSAASKKKKHVIFVLFWESIP